MKVFNDLTTLKCKIVYNDIALNNMRKYTFEFEFTNFIYGFIYMDGITLRCRMFFKGDSNVASPISGSLYNYGTGETTSTSRAFDIRTNWLFANNNMSNRIQLNRYPNDWITKANNTMNTLISYYGSIKWADIAFSNCSQTQPDFEVVTEAGSFLFPNTTILNSDTVLADGYVFDKYVGGEYNNDTAYETWTTQQGSTFGGYGNFLAYYPFVLADGNRDYDLDYDNPFIPFPSDFYITVNCQTDGEDKGTQSLNFTWTPNNIEELDLDLENVSLHFAFTMSPSYTYTETVPYTQDGFSTTYSSIVESMGVPWWRNIINKLPLPSQEINTTINCDIWWSTPSGKAGTCLYIIHYDGAENAIGIERSKDPETELWTYLTADEGTSSQDYDPDPNPYNDLSAFSWGTDAVNGSALLTTSYSLSVAGAHSFGSWLWGTGLDLDQLKMVVNNPIENIVACKLFPFSVTGTASTVKLGNVQSPVSAYLLPENVARTFDFGEINVPTKYNSFLDYAPYTQCSLYLPYIGLKPIDTDLIMGQRIKVRYYVDLVTGTCRALLFLFEEGTAAVKKVCQWDGMIGQDVPVVGSNRAQVEAGYIIGGAQAVANFVGGIGNAVMGNIGAGLSDIGNAVKGGLQTATQQYHTYTSGTPSPAESRFDSQKVSLYINRPVYTKPTKYDHQNGKMCNLTCKLNECKGYTVIDNTVDLTGIPCSKEEREQILKLLTSGVYL